MDYYIYIRVLNILDVSSVFNIMQITNKLKLNNINSKEAYIDNEVTEWKPEM